MFVRMVAIYYDQNNSYEITLNGYQARKINKIRNLFFLSLEPWKTFLSVKGMLLQKRVPLLKRRGWKSQRKSLRD